MARATFRIIFPALRGKNRVLRTLNEASVAAKRTFCGREIGLKMTLFGTERRSTLAVDPFCRRRRKNGDFRFVFAASGMKSVNSDRMR